MPAGHEIQGILLPYLQKSLMKYFEERVYCLSSPVPPQAFIIGVASSISSKV